MNRYATTSSCIGAFAGVMLGLLLAPPIAVGAEFSFDYEWNPANQECQRVTPELKLSGVPSGTAAFKFKLKDLDVPRYNHGGGKMKYSGGDVIPEGALKSIRYNGPCPPGGSHRYQITLHALDGAGKELATALTVKPCCK